MSLLSNAALISLNGHCTLHIRVVDDKGASSLGLWNYTLQDMMIKSLTTKDISQQSTKFHFRCHCCQMQL